MPLRNATLGLLVLLTFQINAQDFHVSPAGSDSNSGTTSAPWKSIQHAMDQATSGSTVHIHEGIYSEALYVNVSGSANNYITFKAFQNDEVIIDAQGQTSTAIVEFYAVHHVALENLILRNHQRNDAVGILIEGPTDHIRINDCTIYDIHFSTDPNAAVNENTNAHAIAVYGDEANHAIAGIEILNNEIYNCRLGYSEALVVNGNVDDFKIINNEVHDVTNIGIDIIGHEGTCDNPDLDQARNGLISENVTYNCLSPYATSAGIYVDGGKDLIIEKNRVYNNQWGIEIGCENIGKTTDNVIVRNNIVYGNETSGLSVGGYDYPSGSGKVTNCSVVNNTFYGNDTENDYSGEIYLSYTEDLLLINNNIFGTSTTAYLLSSEDLTPSLNIDLSNNNWVSSLGVAQEEFYFNGTDYQGISAFMSGTGIASDGMSMDPLFIASGNNPDFRLAANSPMIDKGIANAAIGSEDFAGNNRVSGAAADIGAHEYDFSLSVVEIPENQFLIFPNPASDQVNIDSKIKEAIYVFDVFGKPYTSFNSNVVPLNINLEKWPAGIYWVKNEKGISQKLIKF